MSDKKITRVNKTEGNADASNGDWKPTADNKSKAVTFRVIAAVSWLVAIGFQIWAILKLRGGDVQENGMTTLIILMVVALVFAIAGNLLWKKANKLDPASKKEKFKFFVQNQLGAIITGIAFLPIVILILTNKDLDNKQKGILGGIAGAALLAVIGTGIDFNPASVEQYAEETRRVREINNGNDLVWYTKYGKKYHTNEDCHHINGEDNSKMSGTVASAYEQKNITELCKTCEAKSLKENGLFDFSQEDDNSESAEAEQDEAA